MKIRLASDLTYDSVVDGAGIRTVIWTQGCPHNCPECHNPGTHDYNGGVETDVENIIKLILKTGKAVTFSGGDPFVQPEQCAVIAKACKDAGLNVWAYSGWTYEQLLRMGEINPSVMNFLKNIDRLVDGPFVLALKNLEVPFRGSENQRIIDVPKSLELGVTVEDTETGKPIADYKKDDGIFV